MVPGEYKVVSLFSQTATNGETTVSGLVDTLGYDYCNIIVNQIATLTNVMTTLAVRELATAPAAFTNMTAIIPLTGAAATSTSAGFAFPGLDSAVHNVHNFNIDLKGRERYIGVDIVPHTVGIITGVALLSRGHEGRNQAVSTDGTLTTTTGQLRLDVRV